MRVGIGRETVGKESEGYLIPRDTTVKNLVGIISKRSVDMTPILPKKRNTPNMIVLDPSGSIRCNLILVMGTLS